MSEIDHGIAASIGAVVSGAILGAKDFFTRRKKTDEPPSTLAVRVGRLYEDLANVKQEMSVMRQDLATKLDRLDESVSELCIARAKTDELLPVIRDQIRELRDDMRQQRNRGDR